MEKPKFNHLRLLSGIFLLKNMHLIEINEIKIVFNNEKFT